MTSARRIADITGCTAVIVHTGRTRKRRVLHARDGVAEIGCAGVAVLEVDERVSGRTDQRRRLALAVGVRVEDAGDLRLTESSIVDRELVDHSLERGSHQ